MKAVMAELASGVPVHGALCFVDSDLPAFGNLTFRGFQLLYPKRLAKRMNAGGPVAAAQVRAVAAELALRFPAA